MSRSMPGVILRREDAEGSCRRHRPDPSPRCAASRLRRLRMIRALYPSPMRRRLHLRTRVLLLTGAFAVALFSVTWALSSPAMVPATLAVAWIIVMCSFAAVQLTLRKVVRPLEDLSRAADRIAAGDLAARAPVAGDHE